MSITCWWRISLSSTTWVRTKLKYLLRETTKYHFGGKEFGEWKSYDPNVLSDNDTLPECKNMHKNSIIFEAMALNFLVEDVMRGNKTKASVVYSLDGSAMSGIGNHVVQSFNHVVSSTIWCVFWVKEGLKRSANYHTWHYCLLQAITITNLMKHHLWCLIVLLTT